MTMSNFTHYREHTQEPSGQNYTVMPSAAAPVASPIDTEDFDGLYWKGRTQDFRSLWEKARLPTLALFGEDDEYVDPAKNMALLAGFKDARITTKMFPRANHNVGGPRVR